MSVSVPNVPDDPIEPQRLSDDEIDALFDPLKSFSHIALAVSGGADSVSLLVLFREWQTRSRWPGTCEVLTVDHQLRAESADEATFVASLSENNGYSFRKLVWSDPKPETGIQEAARLARYKLIADHMTTSGAELLLLGHHAHDQVETFLDRLTRGSGVYGLSAMAQQETDGPEGLHIFRPLLDITKARLVASLKARHQVWCEDPSNADRKYKRSRLRQIAKLLAAEGLTEERLLTTVRQMRRARTAIELQLTRIIAEHVEDHGAGPLRLQHSDYLKQAEEIRLRLLSACAERVTGTKLLMRLKKLEALDQTLLASKECRATLGGAVFETDGHMLWCWKEVGRTPPDPLVSPVGAGLWDNRYRYDFSQFSGADGPYFLGYLCQLTAKQDEWSWPEGWPREAFACAPAVWDQNDLLMVEGGAAPGNMADALAEKGIILEKRPLLPHFGGNHGPET